MAGNKAYMYITLNAQNTAQGQAVSSPTIQDQAKSESKSQNVRSGSSFHKNAMKTIISAIIVVFVIVAAIYFLVGPQNAKPSPVITTTTTIYSSNNTTQNPTVLSANYSSCSNFVVSQAKPNTTTYAICKSTGGFINVYYGSGAQNTVSLGVTNMNTGVTFISINSNAHCSTYAGTYNFSPGDYQISLMTGYGGGPCGDSFARFSSST